MCFWYVLVYVFGVFLVCVLMCVSVCVLVKKMFRAQREENFFSVIVCFQYVISVFSVCF